jgi:hypothetical protein
LRRLGTALAVSALLTAGCGGAAERWAALEAEGLPGGPDGTPPTPLEDPEDRASLALDDDERTSRSTGVGASRAARRAAEPGPTADAAADALPPRRLERRLSFVRWSARGLEARLLAQRVRERQSGLVDCLRAHGAEGSIVTITLRYAKGTTSPMVEVSDGSGGPLGACVSKLLGDLALEQASEAPAELVAIVRVVTPGDTSEEPGVLAESEELVVSEGRCLARQRFRCKKPGTCDATAEHEIPCPEEHGLEPTLEPDAATERVELTVGGGRPGQGTHSLVYALAPGRCSLTRIVDEPSRQPPERARETVDASCASFAQARTIVGAKLADKTPKTEPASDAAQKTVTHWKKRAGGEKPSVRTASWSGPSASADAAFEELRGILVRSARGQARLKSSRLDD